MTIRGLLERQAAARPDAVALRFFSGGAWRTRSYGETLRGVREVAEGYGVRFGLKPGAENAAIILGNGPEWVESYLAQAGTGASVVPIDPKLHDDEVAYILKDAAARVVTTDPRHLRMLMSIAKRLPSLRGVVVVGGVINPGQKIDGRIDVAGYESLRVSGGGAWYDSHVARPEDIASIIYTSGTTGRPKGAMLRHSNFVADLEGAYESFGAPVGPSDSFFVVLPLFHAFSFSANFVAPFMKGASLSFCQPSTALTTSKSKVVPFPYSLSTRIEPSIISTRSSPVRAIVE